jgi:hypothetical protein
MSVIIMVRSRRPLGTVGLPARLSPTAGNAALGFGGLSGPDVLPCRTPGNVSNLIENVAPQWQESASQGYDKTTQSLA